MLPFTQMPKCETNVFKAKEVTERARIPQEGPERGLTQPRPRAATRGLVTLLRMSSFTPRHLSPPLLPPTQAQPEAFTANVVTPPRVRPVGALPAEPLSLIFPRTGLLIPEAAVQTPPKPALPPSHLWKWKLQI